MEENGNSSRFNEEVEGRGLRKAGVSEVVAG